MADDQQNDDPDRDWAVFLQTVERLEPDEADKGEAFFDVEFTLSGLGVSGTMSALVTDPANESSVIVEALRQLQAGLETFARVVGRRRTIASIEPGDG